MTDQIDEAARATRKYWPVPHWQHVDHYYAACHDALAPPDAEHWPSFFEAQAACDLKNLEEVLKQLREPSEGMLKAAPASDLKTKFGALYVWRAMIDAVIKEIDGHGD